MAGFNENTRVKIPALMHLTRLGYTYRSLRSMDLDADTNIDTVTFSECVRRLNPNMKAADVPLLIGKIKGILNNEDLGREFYEKLSSNSGTKLIDFEHPEANVWTCVTEMPCVNGTEEFRPDITLMVNGLPLVFIEVKKPNNKGGMLVEYNRMNDARLPNPKFRRFLNLTQLMIFSDNKSYDFTTGKPLQGAFYGCNAKQKMDFNVFREEDEDFYHDYPYSQLDANVETMILKDNNYLSIKASPEYISDKAFNTPTHRIITSLCSRDRLLYLLRYGFAYLDYIDEETHRHIFQKHVMRYPQFFGTQAIRDRISNGVRKGIIWHTQGSGKTALSYFTLKVLTDWYAKQQVVPKYYFFVDRLDLMEQASDEFACRGLTVINVETRDELMETFNDDKAMEGTSGVREIIVVNIQKLKDSDGKIHVSQYATNIQRIFFLDEAHRDYNPKGSFLARLFESDPNAIKIALTGTPLIGEERRSRDVFGDYISTYYYNRSIEDGFTKRILREDIETSYRLKLEEIWNQLTESIKVRKEDIHRQSIIENPRYVGALLDYIVSDFHRFRLQQADNSLGGMVVCETNPQARMMFTLLKRGRKNGTYVPEPTAVIPDDHYGSLPYANQEISAELILHDFYDKTRRNDITHDFKKKNHPDLLIVNNMLLTGFDAHRLKRLYLGRKLKDHNLLQALTRVNRPYGNMRYGYVVDFADIKQNFEEINNAYAAELGKFTYDKDDQKQVATVLVSADEVREAMNDVREVLFDYTTSNAEEFYQDMENIDDHDTLLQIRHKLEEAKALWNQVRTFGDEKVKALVQQMQPGDVNNLLKVVNDRIDNLNLKSAFSHEAEVSGMVNEALATIDFKFRNKGESELEISANIQDEMRRKKQALANEMSDNIDQDDDEYVSLIREIQDYFGKRGFEPSSLSEAKEDLAFMDDAMQRIADINKRNANLQKKYRGDRKYVHAHKKIMKQRTDSGKVLISEKEVETCEALNRMKDGIDKILTDSNDIINNEPFFSDQVKHCITLVLRHLKISAKTDDRRYLTDLITNEYEREYNGWR